MKKQDKCNKSEWECNTQETTFPSLTLRDSVTTRMRKISFGSFYFPEKILILWSSKSRILGAGIKKRPFLGFTDNVEQRRLCFWATNDSVWGLFHPKLNLNINSTSLKMKYKWNFPIYESHGCTYPDRFSYVSEVQHLQHRLIKISQDLLFHLSRQIFVCVWGTKSTT